MVRIRSRIHQYFRPEVLDALYKVCKNVVISDNNMKVSAMLDTLNAYGINYTELGPGTNRLAILIDNYVFKIALDKWGLQDNLNEFTLSQELQPYVIKTYETNELLSVCEYVTVISREEFDERKEDLREVLAELATSYLLGDVGTVKKNFTNWGYRDNGDLVILDFAYIYRVQGDELLCSQDQSILDYDEDFHNLYCPMCRKKYSAMDVRRKITMEQERHENMIAKEFAYKLTKPEQEFRDDEDDTEQPEEEKLEYPYNTIHVNPKEVKAMRRKYEEETFIDKETQDEAFDETLAMLEAMKGIDLQAAPQYVEPVDEDDDDQELSSFKDAIEEIKEEEAVTEAESTLVKTNIIEVDKKTETEETHMRIITKTYGDTDGDIPAKDDELPMGAMLIDLALGTEGVADTIVSAAELIEEVEEDVKEIVSEHSEEDPYVSIMEANDSSEVVTEVTVGDVDGDGLVEAFIDPMEVSFRSPLMATASIDPSDFTDGLSESDLALHAIMDANNGQDFDDNEHDSEVVYSNTIRVDDNIEIENTVKVKVNNEDEAERLRRELEGDIEPTDGEIIDEDRVKQLSEEFMHLEEEDEDPRRGNRDWR